MTARFDLEQDILNVWRITDDLNLLYDKFDILSEDQRMNMLLGIIEMYNLKFEKTWATFEEVIKEFYDLRQQNTVQKSSDGV